MDAYQEKQRIRGILGSKTVVLFLFILLIAMGVATFKALVRGWEVRAEREQVERRLDALVAEKEKISEEIHYFKTDRGVEQEAREKLNMRKPGEEVIIILESEETGNEQEISEKSGNVFHQLGEFLKGFIVR